MKRFLVLAVAGLAGAAITGCIDPDQVDDYEVVVLAPGADLEFRAREALILAKPGTIVEFPAGTWAFTDELTVNTSHIVIRGQGPTETVLDFTNQQTGGQGILVDSDAFVMEDIGVLNPKGDGVRVEGAEGVVFRRVHVTWSGEPRTSNGSYGIYPVQSRNILVDQCFVRGASDAGIYVGQSQKIVVSRNLATGNVAGIEIENSDDADVYLNEATDNSGGLLIFDLPGLPERGCRADVDPEKDEPDCKGTRAVWNWVHENNRPNFAPIGNIVGKVPGGTGMVVLATDSVELRDNWIQNNDTSNLAIASWLLQSFPQPKPSSDPNYDDYPERIHIHGNVMGGGGTDPQGDLGFVAEAFFYPDPVPDILWDGWVDPAKAESPGLLPESIRICIHDNTSAAGGSASFGSLNEVVPPPSTDLAPVTCATPGPVHPPTVLEPFPAPPVVEDPYTPEEIAALCDTGADAALGVNWAAFAVDCPDLADYRLFQDPEDPTANANAGGIPYDLTTPLFSDYAQKYRFVFLPPGTAASYDAAAPFDFPVGTIIAKTFAIAYDLRDVGLGERRVETRLLIHRESGWVGRAWIWDEAQTQASLAIGGGLETVEWIHTDGTMRSTSYQIPNANQCTSCHWPDNHPIGPKARLLNRDFDYGSGPENQLAHWSAMGWLTGAPADPAMAPRLPVWNDPGDGTLEERARAYLESNCAHCHREQGRARSTGLWLEADRPFDSKVGLCKSPQSAGTGSGGLLYDIVPGDPMMSILVYRMAQVAPQIKMPELSKSVVHDEGVALVSDWIEALPGSCP